MEGVVIEYTSHFLRSYRALPEKVKDDAERREKLFRQNPFHPILKTHRLGGKLKGLFSFSVNYRYRILFEFVGGGVVYFQDIGDHSIYQ